MINEDGTSSVALAAKLFRGLADPTRLGILLALQAGERRVVDLVAEQGGSQAKAALSVAASALTFGVIVNRMGLMLAIAVRGAIAA